MLGFIKSDILVFDFLWELSGRVCLYLGFSGYKEGSFYFFEVRLVVVVELLVKGYWGRGIVWWYDEKV